MKSLIIRDVQALHDAAHSRPNSDKESIVSCTSRIFLFGAPLGGLDHKNLLHIAKGKRNFRLISDLMNNSSILENLVTNFIYSCESLSRLTVSFYETTETPTTEVSGIRNPIFPLQ